MKFGSFSDTHWTDEQLIASLYGVGPENSHLEQCESCRSRRSSLVGNRQALESSASSDESVRFEFLAAQRRAIYDKLEHRSVSGAILGWRPWALVALTLLLLGSGTALYERQHARQLATNRISDAQLALEVSKMSQEWQAEPAAPLQGLFE